MNYPAQSSIWRLEMAASSNGKTVALNGKSRILSRSSQIFPLAFFPDQIIVEEARIVWRKRVGPWMEEFITIMATDIASVNCSSGLFFGHIHVQSLTGGPEILVDNLRKKDVYNIMGLIEGMVMTAREGLKIEGESLEDHRENLLRAGHVN